MIKKRFGWFDIYYAEMLLGVTFAIINVCTGNSGIALVCFRIQLGIIQTDNKRRKQKIQGSV